MAKGLNMPVNLKFNTAQAKADLRELQQTLNQITTAQHSNLGITSEIKEAINTAEILKKTLKDATSIGTGQLDLSKFTQAMEKNMMTIDKFKQSLQSLGPEGEKAFNDLAVSITKAQAPVQRTNAMFGELKNAFANSMRWSITSGAIRKVTQEVQKAFNYAQNLDKSLNSIRVVTGHNAEYMNKFADQANKAAKALSASTLEYTNASLIYYQQGLSDREVQKRAETTIKLAKVSGESTQQVSQQLTAVWNNFSNGMDNLERYADVMANLGAHTASSSKEIAKGLEKFAAISNTIGLSYDYAATALATVTAQTRQSADQVGTSFKTLFSRLESLKLGDTLDDGVGLSKYSEALLKVGVNVLDVNGQLRDMDSILDDLGGRWNTLNQAQQVALAQTIGGVRNYTQLIALMDNWETFQENLVTAQLSEGTLQKQAEIYAESWEASKQRVQTSMQSIYTSIISSDFFKGVNNLTTNVLNTIGAVGKALGSSGSFSGLLMLGNRIYKDKFITGINDLENNLFANTSLGRAYAQATWQETLNGLGGKNGQVVQGLEGSFGGGLLGTYREAGLKALRISSNQAADIIGDKGQAEEQRVLTTQQLNTFGQVIQKGLDAQIDTAQRLNDLDQTNRQTIRQGAIESDIRGVAGVSYDQWVDNQVEILNAASSQGVLDAATKAVADKIADINDKYSNKTITKEQYRAELNAARGAYTKVADEMIKKGAGGDEKFRSALFGDLGEENEHREEAVKELQAAAHKESFYTGEDQKDQQKAWERGHKEGLPILDNAYQAEKGISQAKNPILSNAELKTMTAGEFAYSSAQAINATNMAFNSIGNLYKQIKQGEVTFSGLATAASSSMMAFGQWNNLMSQNNTTIKGILGGTVGKSLANKLGQFGVNKGLVTQLTDKNGNIITGEDGKGIISGLSGKGGGMIALAITAAIAATKFGIDVYKANTLDAKIKESNEEKITATAKAKEDKQKYDTFLEIAKQQNNSVNKLQTLQFGTAAYTSQLLTANQQAQDMINNYNLKAGKDYTINSSGAYTFSTDQIRTINEQLEKQSKISNRNAQLATSRFTQLSNLSQMKNLQRDLELLYLTDENGNMYNYDAEEEKKIKTEVEKLKLEKNADYQASLNAYLASLENPSDLQKLAVLNLGGIDVDENSTAYQEKLKGFRDGVYQITGGYVSDRRMRRTYESVFGEVADANMSASEMAEAIISERIAQEQERSINLLVKEYQKLKDNGELQDLDFYTQYENQTGKAIYEKISEHKNDSNYEVLNKNLLNNYYHQLETTANSLLQQADIAGGELINQLSNLTITQLQNLNNYVSNYGTNFGKNTASFIYKQLLNEDGTWNQSFYEELKNLNADSSLQGLAAIQNREQLLNYSGLNQNKELSGTLRDLQIQIKKDIEERGGLAQTLFKSAEFQDTFNTLASSIADGQTITAENIQELAKKNADLNAYLQLSDSSGNKNTAAAVAQMVTDVATGRIRIGQIDSAYTSALNISTGTSGAQQAALQSIQNQDYSTSLSELDKYYQNIGKIWYNSLANNLIADAPLQEALRDILSPEEYGLYLKAVAETGSGNTKDFKDLFKNYLPTAYEKLETWAGTGKKKGKGGGGFEEMFEMVSPFFEGTGINIDKDTGKIIFEDGFEEWYNSFVGEEWGTALTTKGLTERIKQQLIEQGKYSEKQAQVFADQMAGIIASSSAGAILEQGDVAEGVNEQILQMQEQGNITSKEAAAAYYAANEGVFHQLHIDENGKIVRGAPTEGQRGFETEDQYLDYLAEQSGGILYGLSPSYFNDLKKADLNELKTDLAKNSKGQNIDENTILDTLLSNMGAALGDKIYDFEKTSDFFTNTLGANSLQTQDYIKQLIEQGNTLKYNYQDIFGRSQEISSQGMTPEEYIERVTQEQNGTNTMAQQYLMTKAMDKVYADNPNGFKDYNEFLDAVQNEYDRMINQQAEEKQGAESDKGTAEYWQNQGMDAASAQQMANQYNAQNLENRSQPEPVETQQMANQYNVQNSDNDPFSDEAIWRRNQDEMRGFTINEKGEFVSPNTGDQQNIFSRIAGRMANLNLDGTSVNGIGAGLLSGLIVETNKLLKSIGIDVNEIFGLTSDISEQREEQQEEEQGNKKKKGDQTTEQTEEEDENYFGNTEQPAAGGGASISSGSGGGGSSRKTLDEIIADAKANAPEGAISTTVVDPSTGTSYTIDLKDQQEGGSGGGGSSSAGSYGANRASGQNNNLLRFANGKDNFIAMTGELGPELRIKSDGTMDVLGQHGREYAWVNSDDKIYTAAQTASILGDKSIKELQGLAKGINNFIPGFASSSVSGIGAGVLIGTGTQPGSSSGGGWSPSRPSAPAGPAEEEDHRYDPNWLKYRDVIERYYTILQQIEDITNAVTRFSEIADRAWGKQRQEALKETIKLQEDQIEAQKKYLSEIKTYFKGDRDTLTLMMQEFVQEFNDGLIDNPGAMLSFEGAEFDENGVITNYREFAEALVDQFNEKGLYKDQKAQYKFQEQLKDIQQYTETLNLLEEQTQALAKMEEALFDSKLNEIQVVLDYKLSLSQDQMTLIDYALDKVKDDAYEAARAVASIGEQQEELIKQLGDYEDAFKEMLNTNFGKKSANYSVIRQETTDLEDDLKRLEEFKEHFKKEDSDEYDFKSTWKTVKTDGSEVDKEHTMTEYYDSLLKYYTEYYNKYSDLLPDPTDFFIWDDDKENEWDEEKRVLKNEEEILERLNLLKSQLKENSIYADVDQFTGTINNLEDVNKQVTSLYNGLIDRYPELKDAIAAIDEEIIGADGSLNVKNYSNLVKVLEIFNDISTNKLSSSDYDLFLKDANEFFTQMSDAFENENFQNLTSDEVEKFRSQISSYLSTLTQLQENREKMIEYVGDSLKTYFKDINAEIDNFDHIKDIYKDWVNILDLTGRTVTKIDHQLMSSLQSNITDNYKKKLSGVQDAYKLAVSTYDEINKRYQNAQALADQNPTNDRLRQEANSWKEQLAQAEKNLEEAENNRMQSLIDLLERLQEEVNEVFKNAAAEFEDSFSPFFHTLDMLQTAFDREQQLQDLYLDAYDQAHDLSKLNRDIQLSIKDTDNLKSKQELKKLLQEINDLQKAGNKLTQYDVDNLQRQYDIELARQALEDARNAKSLVRLARDNNGNWSYVYTANEEDVEQAQQNFEDKLNEAEKANEDRIKELSNNFIALQKEFEDNLNNLKEQDLTPEEIEAEAQKFYDAYLQKMGNTVDQLQAAYGNNQNLVNNYGDKYGNLLAGLTTDFSGSILSTITGVTNLNQLADQSGTSAGTMMDRLLTAYKEKYEEKKEAWGLAELGLDDAAKETETLMEKLDKDGTSTLGKLTDAVGDSADAFGALIEEVDKLLNVDSEALDNLINKFENLAQSITTLIEASGEYEEVIGKVKIDGLIDDFGDLDKIYKSLIDHGETVLQYIDAEGNVQKIDLLSGEEATMAQLDAWRKAILGTWDASTWTGTGYNYGFDSDKSKILSGLDRGKAGDIRKYYQDLLDEIEHQGIDRLQVSDKLYEKLKEKGINFESEDETKKRATIFFDAVNDSDGVQDLLDSIKEIIEEALKTPIGGGGSFGDPFGYLQMLAGIGALGYGGSYHTAYGSIGLPSAPAAGSAGGCFAAGTQVLMADGSYKNIENIVIGEIVISYDENTNSFVKGIVTKAYIHHNTPAMVKLTFNNNTILELTPGHPLYSINGWKSLDVENSLYEHGVVATLLKIGDVILGINDNIIVTNIEYLNISLNYDSYNIEVEDYHTFIANNLVAHNTKVNYDTGGYTGRLQSADTGMYTGEWPDGSTRRNGRLAWLHQKELVLNAHDTENFLDAMEIVRQLDNLTNWMANGLGILAPTTVAAEPEELEQNVHIEASFPNVTNHSEIEQAFDNLVNLASQYANRK